MATIEFSNCKQEQDLDTIISDNCELDTLLGEEYNLKILVEKKGNYQGKPFTITHNQRLGSAGSITAYKSDSITLIHANYPQVDGAGNEFYSNLFVTVGDNLNEMRNLIRRIHKFYKERGYKYINEMEQE